MWIVKGFAGPVQSSGRVVRHGVLAGLLALVAIQSVPAAEIDADADRVLKAMSAHMASLKAFRMQADIDLEVVMENAQKLQLSASAELSMQRPGKLRARRRGGFSDSELVFDGKTLTLHGHRLDAYAQFPVEGGVDDAIRVYELETGLPAPGADLLFADPYPVLIEGVRSGSYVGTAFVDGVECHHLAFREKELDWQLWVRTGDAPLPMKYVITSTWQTGAPQYQLRIREWDTNPTIDAKTFVFVAPQGATRIESLEVSEFGELVAPQGGK